MPSIVSKIVIQTALILSLVFVSAGAASANPGGSYGQTCTRIVLSGKVLSADCLGNTGKYRLPSKLDISTCGPGDDITNHNGKLACGNPLPAGSWHDSCERAYAVNGVLYAECRTENGDWNPDAIRISSCSGGGEIINANGGLVCRH